MTASTSVMSTASVRSAASAIPIRIEGDSRHEPGDGEPVRPPDGERQELVEHGQAEIEEHALRHDREGGRAGPSSRIPHTTKASTSITVRPATDCGSPIDEALVEHRLEDSSEWRGCAAAAISIASTASANGRQCGAHGVRGAVGTVRWNPRRFMAGALTVDSAGTPRRSRDTSPPRFPRPGGRPWDESSTPPCPASGSSERPGRPG